MPDPFEFSFKVPGQGRFTVTFDPEKGAQKVTSEPDPEALPNGRPFADVHHAILAASPLPDGKAISIETLARLAGYSVSGSFRKAVNDLIAVGKLARLPGNAYRRTGSNLT